LNLKFSLLSILFEDDGFRGEEDNYNQKSQFDNCLSSLENH